MRRKRILLIVDNEQHVIFGTVRHHGLHRDGITELYDVRAEDDDDPEPWIFAADDILEIADAPLDPQHQEHAR